MKTKIENLLGQITEFLHSEARTETVIGKEFKLGDFTCVPVVRVGLGFGYGGGEGDDPKKAHGEGTGGGGGIGIEPLGFLVTKGNEISFVPSRTSKGLSKAFEKMPDVLEKFLDKQEPALAN